mgnify:CR=1 FL=1
MTTAETIEDRIAAAHAAHRAAYDAEEGRARSHWAACVTAGTASGPFPGLAPYALPAALSLSAAASYVARYFDLGSQAASRRVLQAAAAAGTLETASSGRISVSYGDGRGVAGGFLARTSLSYDRYSRASIDAVAAAAQAAMAQRSNS